MSSCLIFINDKAKNIDEILLNKDWTFNSLFNNIYSITINSKEIGYIAKTYNNKEDAVRESINLNKLKRFEGKGVPQILGSGISDDFSFIIISKAPGKCLHDFIFTHEFDEKTFKPIIKSLLEILENIHLSGVIHRDIKPENIMYDESSGQVTIIDFEERSTDGFISPEQLLDEDLTDKTDMWSLGITIYNMITKELPFRSEKEIKNKKITFPTHWSSDFQDFMSCLLDKEALLRYDATDALAHPYLTF